MLTRQRAALRLALLPRASVLTDLLMRRRQPITVVVLQSYPAVQELLEQTLRDDGARVLVTADPHEALEVARRVEVDVFVADDHAEELVREILALQPRIRIVELAPGHVSLREVRRAVIGF